MPEVGTLTKLHSCRLQRLLAVEGMLSVGESPEQLLVPSLQEVVRKLDTQGLMQLWGVLCSKLGGVPFLLQPLVVCPTLVQARTHSFSFSSSYLAAVPQRLTSTSTQHKSLLLA